MYLKTKSAVKMIKIIRKIHSHLNVIDRVYKEDKIQFEQSNLLSKNRFGSKKFKCSNGKVLTNVAWEWAKK